MPSLPGPVLRPGVVQRTPATARRRPWEGAVSSQTRSRPPRTTRLAARGEGKMPSLPGPILRPSVVLRTAAPACRHPWEGGHPALPRTRTAPIRHNIPPGTVAAPQMHPQQIEAHRPWEGGHLALPRARRARFRHGIPPRALAARQMRPQQSEGHGPRDGGHLALHRAARRVLGGAFVRGAHLETRVAPSWVGQRDASPFEMRCRSCAPTASPKTPAGPPSAAYWS